MATAGTALEAVRQTECCVIADRVLRGSLIARQQRSAGKSITDSGCIGSCDCELSLRSVERCLNTGSAQSRQILEICCSQLHAAFIIVTCANCTYIGNELPFFPRAAFAKALKGFQKSCVFSWCEWSQLLQLLHIAPWLYDTLLLDCLLGRQRRCNKGDVKTLDIFRVGAFNLDSNMLTCVHQTMGQCELQRDSSEGAQVLCQCWRSIVFAHGLTKASLQSSIAIDGSVPICVYYGRLYILFARPTAGFAMSTAAVNGWQHIAVQSNHYSITNCNVPPAAARDNDTKLSNH
eukprot:7338-Heterococcus_DN1.PRE.1